MSTTYTKKQLFSGHAGAIYSLQYDGDFIYSSSADKYVVRWDLKTGNQDSFAIKFPATPYTIQLFDNQTKLIAGLSTGDFHIFDLIERKEIKFVKLHKKGIFALAENCSTNHIYVADGEGNLSVWDTHSLNLLIQLPFDCGKIRQLTVSQDGSKLFLGCQDGFIRVIDTHHFNLLDEFHAHENGVGCILEKNEKQLISGGKDAFIKWWNIHSKTCIKTIPAHNFMIYKLFQLNSTTIVSISRDKSIKIWDKEMNNVLQKIDFKHGGHHHSVNSIVAINDVSFATASDDGKIIVWEEEKLS